MVLRAPERMVGVALRIPLSTGTITTMRIATTMNAMIAAMMIWAKAFSDHCLRVLKSIVEFTSHYTLVNSTCLYNYAKTYICEYVSVMIKEYVNICIFQGDHL